VVSHQSELKMLMAVSHTSVVATIIQEKKAFYVISLACHARGGRRSVRVSYNDETREYAKPALREYADSKDTHITEIIEDVCSLTF